MAADGILNVHKPRGPTSFQVVRHVRRLTGERRVGHGGTLDPLAEGVLPVLLGRATRLSRYLMDLPKAYRVEGRLGQATDTYDAEGVVTLEGDPSGITLEELRDALASFEGVIQQVPPPYSAVKVGGRPAYARARSGEAPRLAPRAVQVYRLTLLEYRPPVFVMEVECGRGTYVRSLVHDLGLKLGCGAHVLRLVRLRVGPFALEEAVPPERLPQEWRERLLPPDAALAHLPSVQLDEAQAQAMRHGRPLALPSGPTASQRLRAYDAAGNLLGVLRKEATGDLWRPETVLAS
ncbi:MAG: tRNA pseudouridine(55) synthase TruB [Dehalococcoidia bacterium]|nr:tRNA pseudouridine(55) synthase TruB [Dehalococcoidia bacterium]MDW8009904.1 tRNA pseudouridine(55) synthase TruB [Chloroflexota bacterium]